MKGLYNIGNTCYMNSAIQCLSHIPEFRNYFLTGCHLNYINKKEIGYDLTIELQILLYKLCQDDTEKIINPIDFIKAFILSCKQINFSGFEQNDVEDFIHLMLDIVHKSISNKIVTNISGTVNTIVDKIAVDAAKSWNDFFNNSYSHIINIFYSQILCTTICPRCNNNCINYEPLMSISLSIPSKLLNQTTNTISLYDLFNHYTEEEILDTDNQWKCDSCNTKVNCRKQITFWNLSKILIIVIKKYNMNNKINVNIDYPLVLDLNKYSINYREINLEYNLIGSCIHTGNLIGGHYYAICKKYDEWYRYNDENVSKIPASSVQNENAYCLIYRRK